MDPPNDDQHPCFLDRSSRATRGKRMNKLLDDEIEEDEVFWNQDALKEEENDDEYEEEGEVADEFDSDFDEDESDPDDEADNEADAREKRPKKKLIYPGKPVAKKKKKKGLSKLEESVMLEKEKEKDVSKSEETQSEDKLSKQFATPDRGETGGEVEEEKTVRKSTRTAVIVRQAERAERDAIRAALQATMKPVKRKKEGEEKRMTQEEMLLDAAQTEIMNLRNLERVLAREEEVKKRAIVHKPVYTGPLIRYSSKNGNTYLEFRNGFSFESELSTKSVPYPQKALCAVTGLPAKYRDPKTGIPYATKEAFKVLRERYSNENSSSRSNIDRGELCDSITGQGFLGKRKRSLHHRETSNAEIIRRFSRVPIVENIDSD